MARLENDIKLACVDVLVYEYHAQGSHYVPVKILHQGYIRRVETTREDSADPFINIGNART